MLTYFSFTSNAGARTIFERSYSSVTSRFLWLSNGLEFVSGYQHFYSSSWANAWNRGHQVKQFLELNIALNE